MTPLAQRIVRELTLPVKDRTFEDRCGLLQRMDGIHCFEITEVLPLITDVLRKLYRSPLAPELFFLPAPKTWVEWRDEYGGRSGCLLEHVTLSGVVYREAWGSRKYFETFGRTRSLIGGIEFNPSPHKDLAKRYFEGLADRTGSPEFLICALAIINSPRVIGRRQHMPHRGLEKALLSQQKLVGRFPLNAWTEIVLECKPPKEMSHMSDYEAHLTGHKCLHFCRAHLRLKNGKVEFVNAHWRGDSALGIKQSRYTLTP